MIKTADGEVIVETEEDLKQLLSEYRCATEEQLDDVLWYTYGVSLINTIGKNGKK